MNEIMNDDVREFSNQYLKGETRVSIEAFIEAINYKFCIDEGVGEASTDQGLINEFYKRVDSELDKSDEYFSVSDLYEMWAEIEAN